MRIMQIGDLHFNNDLEKAKKDIRKNYFEKMYQFLENENIEVPVDYLIVCGDIAYHAKKEEYDMAVIFFQKLLSTLDLDPTHVIVCPGNHDLNREKMKRRDIPSTADKIEELYSFEELDDLTIPFGEYTNFCKELSFEPAMCSRDGLQSYLLGVRSFDDVQFLILNTAWASKDDEYDGKMFIGSNFIESVIAAELLDENKITVVVMHHPDSALIDFERGSYNGATNTLKKVQSLSDLTLCGHTHEVELSFSTKYGAPLVICGATFINNHYPNGFACYDFEERKINSVGYFYRNESWDKIHYSGLDIRIRDERARRELSNLYKRVHRKKELSFEVLQNLYNPSLEKYIEGLKRRKKGWLSGYDKALLLLFCTNATVKEVIDFHYPKPNNTLLKSYVDDVTKLQQYREICLAVSLGQMFGAEWKTLYDKIIKSDIVTYHHSIWGESTNEQYRKVISQQNGSEIVQIKLMGAKYKLMENVFSSVHNVVSGMELFLTSPFIMSNKALSKLEINYDAPHFFRGDYLKNEEGSYKIDQVRRVMIIYYNLERFAQINQKHDISIKVHLFTDEYPGFGYQSISSVGFSHIFPDCLPLSKPKFRFAIELNEQRDVVNIIEKMIKIRVNTGVIPVETYTLDNASIEVIKKRVQKELSEYLENENVTFQMIEKVIVCLADKVEKDIDQVKCFLEECYANR